MGRVSDFVGMVKIFYAFFSNIIYEILATCNQICNGLIQYTNLVEGARPMNAWLLLLLLLIARGLHRDRGGPLRRWQMQWRYRWWRRLGSWAGDGSTRTPWGSGPIPSLQSPPHACCKIKRKQLTCSTHSFLAHSEMFDNNYVFLSSPGPLWFIRNFEWEGKESYCFSHALL